MNKELTKRERLRSKTECKKSNDEVKKTLITAAKDVMIANMYIDAIIKSHSKSSPNETDELNINQIIDLLSQLNKLYGTVNGTDNRERTVKSCPNINDPIDNDNNNEYELFDKTIKIFSIMKGVNDD